MHAAVLHTIGTVPRYEEFPEPVIGDKDREVIVHVHAASLKPVDKQLASGSHYASRSELPRVCGSDGVGHLEDGQRVFFGGPRPPHGAMAQRTVVPRAFTLPIPENVSDETAAALPNPGVSAWLSLAYRAKLVRGENVLILGATGVTGKLAVKIARLLGAARVVAAGRNQQALNTLHDLGADATISLALPATELSEAFVRESGAVWIPSCDRLRVGPTCTGVSDGDNTKRICGYPIRDPLCSGWGERCADHHASSSRAA